MRLGMTQPPQIFIDNLHAAGDMTLADIHVLFTFRKAGQPLLPIPDFGKDLLDETAVTECILPQMS